eukprot:TRINITY_DN2383_c0_g1_i2.p2 TRINITY_DN2383_c0_g1~~TRINITY_DN2383_c0_g1_i2.p2  ORF type:complete len:109 (+),score=12.22 TRINITY_DN2383_c0_g1_i2:761-1087(+)
MLPILQHLSDAAKQTAAFRQLPQGRNARIKLPQWAIARPEPCCALRQTRGSRRQALPGQLPFWQRTCTLWSTPPLSVESLRHVAESNGAPFVVVVVHGDPLPLSAHYC